MKKIVVFASGSGSNAENLINYFNNTSNIRVVLVLSNNSKAKVLDRCITHNTSAFSFNKISFYDTNHVEQLLLSIQPDLIVLAGFLWKFPENLLNKFHNKVINIHPALLPKYGGKGMYGMHVHNAIIENNEKETGITIHYVNEHYDDGAIIFQTTCEVELNETPESVAEKIHELEMKYFPKVVEQLLLRNEKQI